MPPRRPPTTTVAPHDNITDEQHRREEATQVRQQIDLLVQEMAEMRTQHIDLLDQNRELIGILTGPFQGARAPERHGLQLGDLRDTGRPQRAAAASGVATRE
ncbi:hypothetical protein Adt_18857 [Abeliophyllum distichum]|uniref:Uncharacterized protein n=1 Tax=Abeliophyllum distichum TaxID=126358 RepID=A0ABD1TKK1_9LAMI